MESEVDSLRQSVGQKPKPRDINELLSCVRNMLKVVFTHLKHSIDIDVNPQKKLMVEVRGELPREAMELPGDAQVIPSGTGAMEIFGLSSTKLSWSDFLDKAPDTDRRFAWKDAIETVIISSIPDRLDVDNSQIIVSRSGHQIYRVVLSRSVRYFDGRREFHLYFVESFRRGDFGNPLTTLARISHQGSASAPRIGGTDMRRYAKRDVGRNSANSLTAPRVVRRFRTDNPQNSAADAPARPA
jgi:hypothetical protein